MFSLIKAMLTNMHTFISTLWKAIMYTDFPLLNNLQSLKTDRICVKSTHHLHFHPPAQISGQPLGLESVDCIPHPVPHGRLS